MFEKTPLEDLLIYRPKVYRDERGYFLESFNQSHFSNLDLPCHFIQDNRSQSVKGTLRGLHLQKAPYQQTKLVGVTKGRAYDVTVDLRRQSPTFGKWFGMELSDNQPVYLYVPRGFAHGFLALSETVEFFYKVDNTYDKTSESGIRFDDPDLAIQWPMPMDQFILSEKDRALPSFKEFCR